MEKIPLQWPESVGCIHIHAQDGYKKGCSHCALLNKQRGAAFEEKAHEAAYKIINPLWKTYLNLVQKKHKKESKEFVVKEAMRLITEAQCPWNNTAGIRLWNNVLIDLARLKDDSYIPVIKV